MKIAFLCGSLEPGRDGVGDYVRRLALELRRQGHWPAGIALNDHYIEEEVLGAQPEAADAWPMLRLPASWPISQRFDRAQQWLDDFGAEWLSLQFVPFSFHAKGLPFGLRHHLARLGKGRAWHLMVHELWVGIGANEPLKYRWWGKLQRHIIKQLIATLQPKVIHTQTPLYQAHLANLGFSSQQLPLFANIPNTSLALANELLAEESQDVSVVIFGSIHAGAPVAQFARDAARYAREQALAVRLTLIGRCGKEQAHWAAAWQAAGLPVEILGEQPPARISEVLAKASLGVATTPVDVIGKSGTAVAMQEHGLPVLCVAHPWYPTGIPKLAPPAGVTAYEEGNFEVYLTKNSQLPFTNTSANVAARLSAALLGKAHT